uniref:T cell receptor beta variable 6-5 n=1 Tax=Gallus gallus TaxID=9031 RepID=A0A8V0ZUM1_CHICK
MFPCWFLTALLAHVGWALQQTPDMIVRLGDSLTLNCSHKESGNWNMFWYKLPVGKNTTLQLIVRSLVGNKAEFEEEFKSRFQSSGTKGNSLSMAIDHVLLNDSGTYFCAKQDTQNSVNNERLIFGTGTKLTVLGKNSEIIEPDVVIFSPSKQEIQEKKKATLVCLASGFFPDHLNLVWKVNGVKRTEGVGTDEISTSNGSTYSLTSRLRISAQEWFNPLNRFECIANFFKNGTQQSIQKIIYGDTGDSPISENYQRSATAGKFVYIMLIFKSILYGIFVMGMMLWYKKMY